MMKRMMLAVAMLLTMCLSSVSALADTVTLTLTNPIQSISTEGGVLTFEATVFAPATNGATLFLNSDSFSLASPLALDDSGFLFEFPLTLEPGGSFTGTLFTLTVPAGTSSGAYEGFFSILGGGDGAALETLATVSFGVSVPEPSGILLAVTALAGLACSRRNVAAGRSNPRE